MVCPIDYGKWNCEESYLMRYKIQKAYYNKEYYLIELREDIIVYVSRTEDYILHEPSENIYKGFREVLNEDIPKYVIKKISAYINNKEQFLIKFEYISDEGFWKKSSEEFDCNVIKQDDRCFEIVRKDFMKEFSEKFQKLNITNIQIC
jgi:hypothetical protein